MMGQRAQRQSALFYEFDLDEAVPQDHLLRAIDRFVDLADVRRHLEPFYAAIGRPSIDPDLMIPRIKSGAGPCCWSATAAASARNGVCARRSI